MGGNVEASVLTAIFLRRTRIGIGNDAKYFQNICTGRHNVLFVIVEKMARNREFDAGRRMRLFTQRKHDCS